MSLIENKESKDSKELYVNNSISEFTKPLTNNEYKNETRRELSDKEIDYLLYREYIILKNNGIIK